MPFTMLNVRNKFLAYFYQPQITFFYIKPLMPLDLSRKCLKYRPIRERWLMCIFYWALWGTSFIRRF